MAFQEIEDGGEDTLAREYTPARVSSPPHTILDMQSDMLLRPIK